jgi:CRP/FNR family transcriptional regulator
MSNVIRLVEARGGMAAPSALCGVMAGGERGVAQELLQMLGAEPQSMHELASLPVLMRRVRAGDALFHEGSAAEALYFVRAGSFKIVRTAEDGYEQVLGFADRAEVLGFDALCTATHPSAAIALEDASVFGLRLRDFFEPGEHGASLHKLVYRAASSALAGRVDLADVMAAVAAEVRLARFLMQLSRRMAERGQSPRRFHLRMTRRDIASYLGVAHETVSRSFGVLARLGILRVDNREVEVVDMATLHAFAMNTRRPFDESGPPSVTARRPMRA